MRLHHIGIVVDSLDESIPLFKVWMKAKPVGGIVEDEAQGARIQLFILNTDTLIEVIESIPGAESCPHQTGDFHLCYTVPGIDKEMQRLIELGAVVTQPIFNAKLFEKRRMAFLATNSGQLIELLEDPTMDVQ